MTASRASLASVRATTLLLVLIAGCGRSRAVEIEPFFEPDVARVEVQIARARGWV